VSAPGKQAGGACASMKPHVWVASDSGIPGAMPKSSDNSINTSICDQKVIFQRRLLPHSLPSASQSPGPGSPGTHLAGSTTSAGAEATQAPMFLLCIVVSGCPLVTWSKGKVVSFPPRQRNSPQALPCLRNDVVSPSRSDCHRSLSPRRVH